MLARLVTGCSWMDAERLCSKVVSPDRPAKTWTHDAFRGVVRYHETGERIAWSDLQRGRMGARVA